MTMVTRRKEHKNFFQRVYLLFSSIGFSVFLFVLLAASSLIGTLIPQRADSVIEKSSSLTGKILVIFSLNDMYHVWWFRLLLLLIAMSLIVCSFERLPGILKIVRKKQKPLSPDAVRRLRTARSFSMEAPLEVTGEKVKKVFGGIAKPELQEVSPELVILYAESGRWTRLGVYFVHGSILLLLLGGLVGSLFGFSGYVSIPEGDIVHEIRTKDGKDVVDPGFSIRCERFVLDSYPDGTPREYRSTLTLLGENAKELLTDDILVNHPIHFGGVRIYQSSYGIADAKKIRVRLVPDGEEHPGQMPHGWAGIRVRPAPDGKEQTSAAVDTVVEMGEFVKEPFKGGELVLVRFMNNFVLRGHPLGPSFIGIYTKPSGEESMLLLPQRYPEFDRMNKRGFSVEIPDFEAAYFTGLQVVKDPGVGLVYAGFGLMILGLWVAFFMSHRQYWVLLERDGEKTLCTLGGDANRNKGGVDAKLLEIMNRLQQKSFVGEKEKIS